MEKNQETKRIIDQVGAERLGVNNVPGLRKNRVHGRFDYYHDDDDGDDVIVVVAEARMRHQRPANADAFARASSQCAVHHVEVVLKDLEDIIGANRDVS